MAGASFRALKSPREHLKVMRSSDTGMMLVQIKEQEDKAPRF